MQNQSFVSWQRSAFNEVNNWALYVIELMNTKIMPHGQELDHQKIVQIQSCFLNPLFPKLKILLNILNFIILEKKSKTKFNRLMIKNFGHMWIIQCMEGVILHLQIKKWKNMEMESEKWHWKSRAQSFISLMADLCQDINWLYSFCRCLNGTFPWRNCSIKILVH